MPSTTLLLIILTGIIAILIALFHYKYKTKSTGNRQVLFAFLRFLTVFSILLLLINPKFKSKSYYIEKPMLNVAIDNSASIPFLDRTGEVMELIRALKENKDVAERFNLNFYTLGSVLRLSDSISFDEKQTNITKALQQLSEIHKNTVAPILLLTDGNQTIGTDYEFYTKNFKQPIFPIVLGDTARHTDLRIQQLNVNRYAFLKNKFPVEVISVYDGEETVNSKLIISSGNSVLHSENVIFSKENNSKIINATIEATSIGVQTLKVELLPLENEKNKANNTKLSAIEVIDQKTNVAIVSDMLHPDLGTLKKSIESNEQRTVSILKPNDPRFQSDDFQLIILYQPNNKFRSIFEKVHKENINTFIITGTQTDWNFLNTVQSNFNKEIGFGEEDVQPVYNVNYATFITEDLGFDEYPPLRTSFGEASVLLSNDVLLHQKIGNVETDYPLLATFEDSNRREAVLFGEDIWKWRAQAFLKDHNFEGFDNFMGKLVQYLASNQRKDRLNISYESFYYGTGSVLINAAFFDKNYVFDPSASLQITIKDKKTGTTRVFPLLLKTNTYSVDLSSLPASDYDFTISSLSDNISKSGSFTILEFNVEQQFLNADVVKLITAATNTAGNVYFPDQMESLVNELLIDERFMPIQKQKESITPLIDWRWLLALIIVSLSLEWFLRKYNGLI